MKLAQEEAIQRVLASDLPHALQTLWIMYATHEDTTESGLPGLSVTATAERRGVGRSTVSRQRKRLKDQGWMTPDGRLTTPHGDVSLYETSGTESGDVAQNETSASSGAQGGDVSCSATSEDVAYSETSASGGAEGGNVAHSETLGTEIGESVSSPSSPRSFSLSPFLSDSHYPIPFSFPHSSPISGSVVEKISTAPPPPSPPGFLGGLPPHHHTLAEILPDDHPAVSERHLRYHMAADWSLRHLKEAEDTIESFRIPSTLRRKIDRDRIGVVENWSDTFRLLQEQDGYEWGEIKYAIHWLFTASDWLREGYIASVAALRKKTRSGDRTKFDTILTQAKADSSYDGPSAGGSIGSQNGHRDESREEEFERTLDVALRAVGAR